MAAYQKTNLKKFVFWTWTFFFSKKKDIFNKVSFVPDHPDWFLLTFFVRIYFSQKKKNHFHKSYFWSGPPRLVSFTFLTEFFFQKKKKRKSILKKLVLIWNTQTGFLCYFFFRTSGEKKAILKKIKSFCSRPPRFVYWFLFKFVFCCNAQLGLVLAFCSWNFYANAKQTLKSLFPKPKRVALPGFFVILREICTLTFSNIIKLTFLQVEKLSKLSKLLYKKQTS